jgi:Lrp/AsnC family transcriptional regulator for asnA, asnC and gidA
MFKIDAIDRRLLDLLQHDGRMAYSRLAKGAGISRSAATARVGEMIKQGVLAIVAATDMMLLGYLVRTVMCRVERGSRRTAARRLAALAEVTYCIVGAGFADIQLEVACRDTEHLAETLERIAAIEGVQILQTFEFLEMVKQSYGWEVAPPENRPTRS